ncbi:MAG: hypothetical protein E7537_05190 [Ruminococcaceae bacterium]|nr:hypothetical protein [Oscillospiraceae bacterium]
MKKVIILLLCLALVFVTGCSGDKGQQVDTGNTEMEEIETTGPQETVKFKLNGEIEKATAFSNGYAIVKTKEQDSQNFWINKKGEVLAVLPDVVFKKGQTYAAKISEIAGGFVLVSEADMQPFTILCDIEGNVYKAEDFEVTAFHPDALADGYILTSTAEDGESVKIGVVDSDMMWVLRPSEEHAAVLGSIDLDGAKKLSSFYKDHLIYGKHGSFNVKNGDLVSKKLEDAEKEKAANSEYWEFSNGGYGYKIGDKFVTRVNLYKLRDADYTFMTLKVDGAKFVDGKAPLAIGNHQEQDMFSLINEQGEMVFKPVKFGGPINKIILNSGYILVVGEKGDATILKTYDMKGKSIAKFDGSHLGAGARITFQDGVIKIEDNQLDVLGIKSETFLYKPDFTKLF